MAKIREIWRHFTKKSKNLDNCEFIVKLDWVCSLCSLYLCGKNSIFPERYSPYFIENGALRRPKSWGI